MRKLIPSAEVDRVLAAVASAAEPAGLGVAALLEALGPSMARRTLQRRLATLVAQQRLISEGAARALRYRLPAASALATLPAVAAAAHAYAAPSPPTLPLAAEPGPAAATPATEPYVPTSAASDDIKAAVRRPLHLRRPVGYNIALLEAYHPNQSAYLPAPLRAQLLTLGRSSIDQAAPAGTFARDILSRLLIDLSWASSRLEGNTYSRLDTERLIDFGQAAEGKDAFETQMILNHKAAIEFLVGDPHVAVDTASVIALHALLSDGLLRNPMAGGRVRQRAVEISASVYRPLALPQRLEELFGIVLRMAADIEDPFEQAFFLMVHLPYLQPFEDVNKRVSRLAANIPLMRHNLCPLSFLDVPAQAYIDGLLGVYELGRTELLQDVFVWAYERSCQQYVAVRPQLMPPDTFRLRYRAELGRAVQAIVRQNFAADAGSIARVMPEAVTAEDHARFAALVREEFATLHAGNAIRFGLGPQEFSVWQQGRPLLDAPT